MLMIHYLNCSWGGEVTTITYAGNDITTSYNGVRLYQDNHHKSGTKPVRSEVWFAFDVPTGSNTLTATCVDTTHGSKAAIYVHALSNASTDPSNYVSGANSTKEVDPTLSMATTASDADGLVISAGGQGDDNNGIAPGSGETQLYDVTVSNGGTFGAWEAGDGGAVTIEMNNSDDNAKIAWAGCILPPQNVTLTPTATGVASSASVGVVY
jgi:hypothetical protein